LGAVRIMCNITQSRNTVKTSVRQENRSSLIDNIQVSKKHLKKMIDVIIASDKAILIDRYACA